MASAVQANVTCPFSLLALPLSPHTFVFQLRASLLQHGILSSFLLPLLEEVPDNGNAFCYYGTILIAILFDKNIDWSE